MKHRGCDCLLSLDWKSWINDFNISVVELCSPHIHMGFPSDSAVKNLPAMQELQGTWVDPWVRKSVWRSTWQPTPVFLPGESMDRGAWWATVHRVTKSWTQRKHLSTYTHKYIINYSSIQWLLIFDCFQFETIIRIFDYFQFGTIIKLQWIHVFCWTKHSFVWGIYPGVE